MKDESDTDADRPDALWGSVPLLPLGHLLPQ